MSDQPVDHVKLNDILVRSPGVDARQYTVKVHLHVPHYRYCTDTCTNYLRQGYNDLSHLWSNVFFWLALYPAANVGVQSAPNHAKSCSCLEYSFSRSCYISHRKHLQVPRSSDLLRSSLALEQPKTTEKERSYQSY